MKSLLCAVLIVKNEAASIERTLGSLVGVGSNQSIVDSIFVADTGSTDGTQKIVQRFFEKEKRVKGHLVVDVPFRDFADARNNALTMAEGFCPSVFTLTMSADEVLLGGLELVNYLAHEVHGLPDMPHEHNAFCVMMRTGELQWPFPRILRSGGGWKFVNATGGMHEQPVGPNEEQAGPLIPGVYIQHTETSNENKLDRLREHDLPMLTKIVEDESKSLSERLEPMFQLAQTHFSLGHNEPRGTGGERSVGGRWLTHLMVSMSLYARFAEIAEAFASKMEEIGEDAAPFMFQKAMYAQYMYLQVAESFGLFEPTEIVKRASVVAGVAPQIPEIHFLLARCAAKVDVRKAIALAMRSAKMARAVYERPVHGATDTTLEWKSLLLAADCARVAKDKKLQESFAKQALLAGAPTAMVEGLAPA